MHQKGLLTRKTCTQDRRRVDVSINEQGMQLLAQLDDKMLEWESDFHTVSEQEALNLNALLDKFRG